MRKLALLAALAVLPLLVACGGGSGGNGLEFVYKDSPLNTDPDKVVQVSCPPGKKALGGGEELTAEDGAFNYIVSEPINGNVANGDPPDGWVAAARATPDFEASGRDWSIAVMATCGSP